MVDLPDPGIDPGAAEEPSREPSERSADVPDRAGPDPRFVITRRGLDEVHRVPVSAEDFRIACEGRKTLHRCVQVEERWDFVIESLKEFELDLLENALEFQLRPQRGWEDVNERLYRATRRCLNLLSTARLYVDQTEKAVQTEFGRSSDEMARFQAERKKQEETSWEFRAANAIRNYGLHSDLPGDELGRNAWWDRLREPAALRHSASLRIYVSRLSRDKRFDRSVLGDLSEQGDVIDLRAILRGYIGALRRLQAMVRELLDGRAGEAERHLRMLRQKWVANGGEGEVALCVARLDDEGFIAECSGIGTKHAERYRHLARINWHGGGDLRRESVTSELSPPASLR